MVLIVLKKNVMLLVKNKILLDILEFIKRKVRLLNKVFFITISIMIVVKGSLLEE